MIYPFYTTSCTSVRYTRAGLNNRSVSANKGRSLGNKLAWFSPKTQDSLDDTDRAGKASWVGLAGRSFDWRLSSNQESPDHGW